MDGDEFGFSNLSITIYIYISMHQNQQFTNHYHKYFQEERGAMEPRLCDGQLR